MPDSLTPGSTPAKAVIAPLWVNRVTSPISAMSWGPSEEPTPFISITTGYSGSLAAVSFMSVRNDSTVVEVLFNWSTACLMMSFVMSSFGSTGASFFALS